MQSVRLYAKGDLRVEQIADPKPPAKNEVTLAVAVAGICGSDLHNYKTGAWISRSPSVAGHEFSGIVTALGAGVDHVALGQARLGKPLQMLGAAVAQLQPSGVCISHTRYNGSKGPHVM